MENKYYRFTRLFNLKKTRVIIASGQAVVLHQLAMMSKDADWIIREDEESFAKVLKVLAEHGARYRFGAPLDIAWHKYGWSSHFELFQDEQRLRLDFFSRPPRLSSADLATLWQEAEDEELPFVDKHRLIKQKLTDRLKDYAIIGELVRSSGNEDLLIRYGQSAAEIIELVRRKPGIVTRLKQERTHFAMLDFKHPDLELQIRLAIEQERYSLMKTNLARIEMYRDASRSWAGEWANIERSSAQLRLEAFHIRMIAEAKKLLPQDPETAKH